MSIDKTLYDRLGGKQTFIKVHKIFYDKAFADPWLRQYFTDKPQDILENQQTDFMAQLMGGPKIYAGKTPKSAHQHMMISDKLFEWRSRLLSDSLKEVGIDEKLRKEWIAADATLKKSLVKSSIEECRQAYPSQMILDFKK